MQSCKTAQSTAKKKLLHFKAVPKFLGEWCRWGVGGGCPTSWNGTRSVWPAAPASEKPGPEVSQWVVHRQPGKGVPPGGPPDTPYSPRPKSSCHVVPSNNPKIRPPPPDSAGDGGKISSPGWRHTSSGIHFPRRHDGQTAALPSSTRAVFCCDYLDFHAALSLPEMRTFRPLIRERCIKK